MEAIINSYYANNGKKLRITVDKILFKLHFCDVDNDDFYSLANEVFVDVLKRYNKSQPFDCFLCSCLSNKFKSEMTKRGRYKRQTDKMAISIETPIGEDDESTIGDMLRDKRTVESEFFEENEETFSPEMMKYLSRLSPLQREVLHLISIGYTPNEILRELHINKKLYDDCYNAIHAYRNIEILM